MAKDPAAAAKRWADNLGAATQKITEGVNAVTVAPGQAAARQKAVWLSNLQQASDKWAANVAAVPLQEWQAAMNGKGTQRISMGATDAIPKMTAFLTSFLPHVEAGVRSLPPRGGLSQNIDRMVKMVQHNANYKRPAGAR